MRCFVLYSFGPVNYITKKYFGEFFQVWLLQAFITNSCDSVIHRDDNIEFSIFRVVWIIVQDPPWCVCFWKKIINNLFTAVLNNVVSANSTYDDSRNVNCIYLLLNWNRNWLHPKRVCTMETHYSRPIISSFSHQIANTPVVVIFQKLLDKIYLIYPTWHFQKRPMRTCRRSIVSSQWNCW